MHDRSEPDPAAQPVRGPDTELDVLQARADALRAAGRGLEADMIMAWRDLHAGRRRTE
ncbi:MAG: hypothetical protein ACK4WC_06980 [Rubrimonas sp.]